jgi:general secretion pathway protein N
MRRLPVSRRRAFFFLGAFLFALLALFPLRLGLSWLGLDQRGFSAREAEGSLWLGSLREVQLGPIAIGDVTASLSTLPLFIGRARIELERRGEPDRLEGAATVSRHGFGIDDLTASLRLAEPVAGLPVAGIDPADLSVHFSGGLCRSADGLVRTTMAGELPGLALPSTLSGNARCDGGALLLPLASQSGMEALNLRLFDDGRYRAELVVRAGDAAAAQRLAASGFVPSGAGYALRFEGEF